MAFDLHITGGTDPSDNARARIPVEEWLALVEEDTELERREALTTQLPSGAVLTMPMENLAVWTGHPGGKEVPFMFFDGRVTVRLGDGTALAKALQIADALGAHLRGDEGELYFGVEDRLQAEHG